MREVLKCCDDIEGLEVVGPEEHFVDSRGIGVLMAARCVLRVPVPARLVSLPKILGCYLNLAVLFISSFVLSSSFIR